MRTIRIYFNYKHIDEPWGGANNFIKVLHAGLHRTGRFEFAESIEDDYDILFLNQLGMGPATGSRPRSLKEIRAACMNSAIRKKTVVRAVNLRQHSHGCSLRSWFTDIARIRLVNMADMVVFQSEYLKGVFRKYGYKGKRSTVIHNGADDSVFNNADAATWHEGERLKLVSSSISRNPIKLHSMIARFSQCDAVEVVHLGNWPDSVDKRNVKLLGVMKQKDAAAVMKRSHVLLHPAIKDSCPNVVFEGICCGLPVIYNDKIGSSREIVKANGVPINENNIEETVRRVTNSYRQLKENIEQTRSYYSIKRAMDQYIQVFADIVSC